MVITKEEYSQIKSPYIKESVLIFLFFIFLLSIFYFSYQFYFSKNNLNLIFLFISLTFFLSLSTIIILVSSFFLNLGLIIFQALILFGIASFYLKNVNFALIISIFFLILHLFYWWKIVQNYKNSLKFNFFHLLQTLWGFTTSYLLLLIFLSIIFFFSFKSLSKESIEKFIGKISYVFEILNLGITPNTKVEDILAKNLPQGIDEKTKREILSIGLEELNKRLNTRLKLETTFKEALGEYIYLNFQKIESSNQLTYKIILGLFFILILRYFLLIFGYFLSFFGYLIFLILKYFKLVKIEHQLLEKEIIKI